MPTARLMLGAEVSAHLKPQILRNAEEVRGCARPALAALLAGANDASEIYLRNKRRTADAFGFCFELIRLPDSVSKDGVIGRIKELNRDVGVHGVFVQLPLPPALEEGKYEIFDAIDPVKDVDGLTAANTVEFYRGSIGHFVPATVRAVLEMMLYYGVSTRGKRALVVGRNDITGKPFAVILGGRAGARFDDSLGNAEVVWCNRHTPDGYLREAARQADIVVSCAGVDPRYLGREYLIPGEDVKEGAAVFDVAIRRTGDRVVGDVEFEAAAQRAGSITPVPGGVGPMTVTALMQNVLDAARRAQGTKPAEYVHRDTARQAP